MIGLQLLLSFPHVAHLAFSTFAFLLLLIFYLLNYYQFAFILYFLSPPDYTVSSTKERVCPFYSQMYPKHLKQLLAQSQCLTYMSSYNLEAGRQAGKKCENILFPPLSARELTLHKMQYMFLNAFNILYFP